MKIRNRILLFLSLFSFYISSYAIIITPVSQFSILTNTPGDELYTIFGHIAIRFQDSSQNVDIVFNYGTFDFRTPNFYMKFVKGRLDYFLSVETFRQYLWNIKLIQSSYEQVLNLDKNQKEKLLIFLLENAKPENKYYKYEFFDDNCATRIRDALKFPLGDDVNFDFFQPDEDQTFRQLLSPYLKVNPWIDLGINLLLGIYADNTMEPLQYFYLPDYVMEAIAVSTINHNNEDHSLVSVTNIIQEAVKKNSDINNAFSPILVFSIILFIILIFTSIGIVKNRKNFIIDRLLFGITGLLGLFLFAISVYTDHLPMKQNLDILWAFPLHLFVIFILKKDMLRKFLKYYFLVYLIILSSFTFIWIFFKPSFYFGLIPLLIALTIRSTRLYYFYR